MGDIAPDSYQSIPRLDFGEFASGDLNRRSVFCHDLVESIGRIGFVRIINHPIDAKTLVEAFEWNKTFFGLPLALKQKAPHPVEPNPHRGYSHVGQESLPMPYSESANGGEKIDYFDVKETFDQGPATDVLYPNRWPDEDDIPGFRGFMEMFFELCHHTHLTLLTALCLGVGCKSTLLPDICSENSSEMRLNHYPGCESSMFSTNRGARRISEHTDFGTLTLLFQDSVSGLEVEHQDIPGLYVPVPATVPEYPAEMIVNVGDCLQRWTNDRFRSARHRVVAAHTSQEKPAVDWVNSRYSIAYFGKPNRSQGVGTLPEFIEAGQQAKYRDMTALEYNQLKLLPTY